MSVSLMLAFLWVIITNVSAMFPSKDNYWTRAYILIAIGLPLLGYVIYRDGIVWGLIFFAAGASMLRWTLVYFWRWIKRRLTA